MLTYDMQDTQLCQDRPDLVALIIKPLVHLTNHLSDQPSNVARFHPTQLSSHISNY